MKKSRIILSLISLSFTVAVQAQEKNISDNVATRLVQPDGSTSAFLLVDAAKPTDTLNGTNAPVKPYPLTKCIVCGMVVKGRTDIYSFVYKGQEIKLCEPSEKEEFDKNPAKYLKTIAKEVAKQKQNSTNQ